MKGDIKRNGKEDGSRLGHELFGLFAIFCGLLFILSLATFDSRDPWLNHVVSEVSKTHNKAGLFGAYLAGLSYDMLGVAAWVLPAFLCLAGARRILGAEEWPWWRWTGFLLLIFCISLAGAARDMGALRLFATAAAVQGTGNVATHGGGIFGQMIYTTLAGWMGPTGAMMIWLFSLLLAMQMLTGISWADVLGLAAYMIWRGLTSCARAVRDAFSGNRNERGRLRAVLGYVKNRHAPAPQALPEKRPETAHEPARQVREKSPEPSLETPVEERALIPDLFKTPAMPDPAPEALSLDAPELGTGPISLSLDTKSDFFQPSGTQSPQNQEEELFFEPPFRQPPPLFSDPAGAQDKAPGADDELPPILRDFEEGRVGMEFMPADAKQISRGSTDGDHPDMLSEPEPTDDDCAARPETSPPAPAGATAALPCPVPADAPPYASDAAESSLSATLPVSGSEGTADAALHDLDAETLHEKEERDATADSIPIFEAPPVQAAPAASSRSVAGNVLQGLRRPSRDPLPSLDLLEAAKASTGGTPRELLEAKGRSLMTCLNDFGVQGELVGIIPGPVVTMFEVRPAPGVRVSRIANLSDDLALALKAVAVRIQAPVPGTDTVGVEIPNEVRETVCLKELLGSKLFQDSKSLLTLALGKDIAGLPAVADLGTMPHLLVAGATGAGKSVGINSIILSLLYKARPEEVKLLLVDPKRVEMAIYADLPHLVHPVVTEMQLAKNALEWAVSEMEERYNAIAKAGVRNISDYNAKVASWGQSPPEGMEDLLVIPYLVIVIDELADLMLVAAKEVETSIVRLAQLARAAGIHLILATQRPSVDVVTGLIKANFPCRMSFQVTSKHDSRTILDAVGAEHLLGKGDMLFKPGGGKFKRMHGAFVSDNNVHAVVEYWKSRQRPEYTIDFADWSPETTTGVFFSGSGGGGGGDIAGEPLYNEAVEFVRQQGKASISLIQRKFRIGFNKAARFVEQMEQDGIIGPADGSKPRFVIK